MTTAREASRFGEIADDATLMRARSGERDALGELWAIYQPQLLRLLSAKRAPSAEDVASRVWIDVGRAVDRFVGDGDAFRRWIFTIARRRTIDEARRVERRAETSSYENSHETAAWHIDTQFDTSQSVDAVAGLVRQLPQAAAEVVMLRIVHDMSVGEVATITGRSESNVRVLSHRGLRQLRAVIETADDSVHVPGDGDSGSDEVGDLRRDLLHVPG